MSLPSELLKPQLRLFMSVDVQDSTAFKQQADEQNPAPWRGDFFAFFWTFPNELEKKMPADARHPQVWKFLGDEIVFSLKLTQLDDASTALRAFRDTVANFEPIGVKRKLRLKGSAWIAGFPVGNAVVPVDRGEGRTDEDYIGPSMDTGFRLSRLASQRKLVVSVELAWLLLHLPASKSKLPLHYEGRCQLKGVMEREGYPFIWTDLFHQKRPPLIAAEDALKASKPAKLSALRTFCERYIRQHGEPRFVPFIPSKFDSRTAEERKEFQIRLAEVKTMDHRSEHELTEAAKNVRSSMKETEQLKLSKFKKLLGLRA